MRDYFALVVGSSFSGSLLAWILQKNEREVLLIDRALHPRFAIGESTTPTADYLVKHLTTRWGLDALAPLARYGSWQRTYPNMVCGKKRGFVYYGHRMGEPFQDDDSHSRSMMVAASADDEHSDTHWLRSSVDAWLYDRALEAGVSGRQQTTVENAVYDRAAKHWIVSLRDLQGNSTLCRVQWLLDASGGTESLQPWMGVQRDDAWMRTRTSSVFGHFEGVNPFARHLDSYADDQALFDGDDSAQHHVFELGWMWVLRFNNGVTSLGFVLNDVEPTQRLIGESIDKCWQQLCNSLPSLSDMLCSTRLVGPREGIRCSKRLSRCNTAAVGAGWVSLPTAFGFVDPLHSTGIAHALSGVDRVAEALLDRASDCNNALQQYAVDVREEMEWLDTLVGLSYRGLPSFKLFTSLASYYFMAAIGFERDVAKHEGRWPRGYMLSKDTDLRNAAELAYKRICAEANKSVDMTNWICKSIAKWNDVGLLDPLNRNRIAHSAAKK